MFEVNVAPDMGMYTVLRNQGYEPAYALAEFIDNALQAYLEADDDTERTQLEVTLKFHTNESPDRARINSVTVEDNGPGISRKRLPEALKPAHPPTTHGLSEFGIGMKAAAVWFTDTWTLETTPSGSRTIFRVDFDLEKLLSSGKETIAVTEKKATAESKRGTTINLVNIRKIVDKSLYDRVCTTLRELYQRFTQGESPRLLLRAEYDGTPTSLAYPASDRAVLSAAIHRLSGKELFTIGPPKTWTVEIDTVFMGKPIHGRVSIMEKGSYTNNPGLVLFRNDRVIRGTTLKPYLPAQLFGTSNKFSAQRIYGELDLDDLPVSYTKDDFQINESAFIELLRSQEGMSDLLQQSDNYRATHSKPPTAVSTMAVFESRFGKAAKGSTPRNLKIERGGTGGDVPADLPRTGSKPMASSAGSKGVETPVKVLRKVSHLIELMSRLYIMKASLSMKSLIEETMYQYRNKRPIAAAMCLRAVIEQGLLDRLQRDFPTVYLKVSSLGLRRILGHLHHNGKSVFEPAADQKVIKCVESAMSGQQLETVLLNNIAHGSYAPTHGELDKFVATLEPLLLWAYG